MPAPSLDTYRFFENGERRGVDALTTLAAEACEAAAQLLRDTSDGQLRGHVHA
jgi:hypothetical protein